MIWLAMFVLLQAQGSNSTAGNSIAAIANSVASSVAEGFGDIIQSYGYAAVFALMLLEGIGFPVPSEVVLPLAGYYAAQGAMSPILAFIAVFAGTTGGLVIDYYIGYYLGKDVIYRHMALFRVDRVKLEAFDRWFVRNGTFAVFIVRFIPEIRALISVPAGFARMSFRRFMAASLAGTFIWDVVLMWFGYRLQSTNSIYTDMVAVSVFIAVLYMLYRYGTGRMLKGVKGGAAKSGQGARRHGIA